MTQTMLGLRFEPARQAPRWHEDVQAFDVYEANDESNIPFARFYMDLFPRPNKYGHAAAFTLRRGRQLRDGSYVRPVSAIVGDLHHTRQRRLPPPRTASWSGLHDHRYILHDKTSATRCGSGPEFSGTVTERHFVEAPSQMLEHWDWQPDALWGSARHHEDGRADPGGLIKRRAHRGEEPESVLLPNGSGFLRVTLDFTSHSPGFDGDTT